MTLLFAGIALLGWVYLALFHGRFWEPLLDDWAKEPEIWPSVDIVVPMRNEAAVLPQSLTSLLAQNYPGRWRVVLVDDHSTDGTAEVARGLAAADPSRLLIVKAPDLPKGWGGKVAAMQMGVLQGASDYILFTDADIQHPRHSLRRLVARAVAQRLDLTSLMVKLNCVSTAEKLLIPAFVFFFAMLYPFRRARNDASRVAAAAGGVMLVRRKALEHAGGLKRIKATLIDDCSLARIVKDHGGEGGSKGAICLTLTREVFSLRPYPALSDITRMVARTAFTQLRHSTLLLAGTVLGMGLLFLAPIACAVLAPPFAALAGFASWLAMTLLYWPMVRFYGLPFVWALTLPIAAVIYILATLDSARQHWLGKGGTWKGRVQGKK